MRRPAALLPALAALFLVGLVGAASAKSSARQDLKITADDGLPLAATLYLPSGTPPASGWPAIVMFHGLGGSREDMNKLAQLAFLPGDKYAVLTYDARGHGETGGLIGVDGPREVADAREVFDWLAARSVPGASPTAAARCGTPSSQACRGRRSRRVRPGRTSQRGSCRRASRSRA